MVDVYIDGFCEGNPGPGGWGVYCEIKDNQIFENCGGEKYTTNNKMELMAAIKGLELINDLEYRTFNVFSDSQYVVKGINYWIMNWISNNWKTYGGSDVKNKDLWIRLSDLEKKLSKNKSINFKWIKGHSGIKGNEKADQLSHDGYVKDVLQKEIKI